MKFLAEKITQSVVPVIVLLGALLVLVLLIEHKASFEADRAKYIHVAPHEGAGESEADEIEEIDLSEDERIIRAQTLSEAKRYSEAESIYIRLLSQEPSSQLHNWLGVLYLKQGLHEKALVSFSNALQLRKDDYRALYNRALTYTALGMRDKAVSDYEQVIRNFDAHVKSHFNLGLIYYKQKAYALAKRAFSKAASLSSGDQKVKALYLLGNSLRKSSPEQVKKAVEVYQATIRIKPDHIPSRLALMDMEYAGTSDKEAYLKGLEDLRDLDPESIPVYRAIAQLHHEAGNESLRLETLEEALRHDPNDIGLQLDTAELLIKAKREQDAIARLEEALMMDAENLKVYALLGRLYYRQQRYDTALEVYEKILRINPRGSVGVWDDLGELYMRMKAYDKAEESYLKALQMRPDSAQVYYHLGQLAFRTKAYENAKAYLQEAIRLNPEHALAHYSLGNLFGRYREHEQSIEAYKRVLELRPQKIKAILKLAEQYMELKQYAKAREFYQEVLKRDESYFTVWFNLGLIDNKLKAYETSIVFLKRALALDSEDENANRALAKSYRALEMFDEAIEILEKLLERDPSDVKTRVLLARTYYRYEKYVHALKEYQMILKLSPENRVAQRMIQKIQRRIDARQ